MDRHKARHKGIAIVSFTEGQAHPTKHSLAQPAAIGPEEWDQLPAWTGSWPSGITQPWGQSPLKITDAISVERAEGESRCGYVRSVDVRENRIHGCHRGSMLYLMDSDCGSEMFWPIASNTCPWTKLSAVPRNLGLSPSPS